MYESFYKLRENPFSFTPNPKYLYLTENHREALAVLFYGIKQRKGFVAITGEIGTGKTTLINALLEELNPEVVLAANIFNPILGRREFFETILTEFGINVELKSKTHFLKLLNDLLLDRYRQGLITILIIDEAQNLSNALLEEIRLLTNLETSMEKLLQIVLVGQPELWEKLKGPELKQLRQRINLHCRLRPLSEGDIEKYIKQRLSIAGAQNLEVFSKEAIKRVGEFSSGIPRLINKICDSALTLGYTYNKQIIDRDIIEEIGKDFELEGKEEPKPVDHRPPVEEHTYAETATDAKLDLAPKPVDHKPSVEEHTYAETATDAKLDLPPQEHTAVGRVDEKPDASTQIDITIPKVPTLESVAESTDTSVPVDGKNTSQSLLADLLNVSGVNGVVIATQDGKLLSQPHPAHSDTVAVLAAFFSAIGQESEVRIRIWDLLIRCVTSDHDNKIVMKAKDNSTIAAFLGSDVDYNACTSEINNILQKYFP